MPNRFPLAVMLCLAVLAALVYGSLYPFRWGAITPAALASFWSFGTITQNDLLFNIVALLPYGFLLPFWRYPERARLADLVGGFFLGCFICIGAQVAQLWLPSRSAQLDDAWANIFGICIGMALPRILAPLLPQEHRQWQAADWSGLLLIGLLGTGLLLPIAIDSLSLGPAQAFKQHALALFARDANVNASYSLASLVLISCVLRTLGHAPVSHRFYAFSALVLASTLALDALAPFAWRAVAMPFNWVPFALTIQTYNEFHAAAQVLREMAWSGGLLWLCLRAGLSWRMAFPGCLATLAAGEALQTRIASGWPDITDLVVFSAIALVIYGLELIFRAPAALASSKV
jgi:glycopeptide antibiotics resistance protein